MNDLIRGFKDCAHLAGEICRFSTGKMLREFGLGDFLENKLQDSDDAPTIAVKALAFFCEEVDTGLEVFKFGVLAVGSFLNNHHAKRGKQPPQQALRDLVMLLKMNPDEQQIRGWIISHFG
jgi:hypothetical protein